MSADRLAHGRTEKGRLMSVGRARMVGSLTLLAATVAATLAALFAVGSDNAKAADPPPGFNVICDFCKTAMIDPIVDPGMQSEHLHDFFGGEVNANSDRSQLVTGTSTCEPGADRTGYWAPTAYLNGIAQPGVGCPDGYHATPTPTLAITYSTKFGSGITLSSGEPYTMHADFLDGWSRDQLDRLIRLCVNSGKGCNSRQTVSVASGEPR